MRRQNRGSRGKLKKLARSWAGGRSSTKEESQWEAECAAFGIETDALDWSDGRDHANAQIWPDMIESVALFFNSSTQGRWASAGMAGAWRVGLDYVSLEATARLSGLSMTPAIFNDIRTLEQEALAVWNRKR